MNHDELATALERERICGDPAALEAERYRPGGVERVPGLVSPYTPITEERAEQNMARLKQAVGEEDALNRKDHW
jgi:hypothetical protein